MEDREFKQNLRKDRRTVFDIHGREKVLRVTDGCAALEIVWSYCIVEFLRDHRVRATTVKEIEVFHTTYEFA
jgi:hypothetical protein